MYGVAGLGLRGPWRSRPEAGGGGRAAGALLVGFGLWHVVDGVLSHWVLGIHRVRLDSPDPLMWDLSWLAAFGFAPLTPGLLLLTRRPAPPAVRSASLTVLLLGLLTGGAAFWPLQPPADQPDLTTVAFRTGSEPVEVFAALAATDARLAWPDPDMTVVVLSIDPRRRWSLYRQGAILVSGSGAPPGGFAWSRA